jgi:hypothetical protein
MVSKRYAVWSGDENIAINDEIKAVFNSKDNLDGINQALSSSSSWCQIVEARAKKRNGSANSNKESGMRYFFFFYFS